MAYLGKEEGREVLFFIHGAGNRAEVWEGVMGRIPNRSLYAVDLPGHGLSSCKRCERIEDYSRCILQFMEAKGIEEAILVGHSMGGAIAIKATLSSDRVKGLVLVGTGATLKVNPKLLEGLREDFPQAVERMTRWSFRKGAPQELLDKGKGLFLQAGQEVLYQDMKACDDYSSEEELGRISVPTLIICGDTDVMTPPELSQRLHEGIKGSELVLIEGSGHMVHVEKGGEVGEAIARFLEEKL